jgi:LysM repeat protein
MRRVGSILFVLFNVILSAGVAFAVLQLAPPADDGTVRERLVTFEVIITATRDPNANIQIVIVTATPGPEQAQQFAIPDDVREGQVAQGATPVPSLEPGLLDEEGNPVDVARALPAGCIEYTVAEGDSIAALAVEYDVSMSTMLLINGLDEDSARGLQIGDTLIVPLEGCPVEQFIPESVSATEEDTTTEVDTGTGGAATTEVASTATATRTTTPRPTVTLAPTAENAQLEIEIVGAGDITSEAVTITNPSNTVDISGWTLSDGDGNAFTFPQDRRLFSQGTITVATRSGTNTAILLFWGRDQAVFAEPGDVIILSDTNGVVQASIRLP